MSVPLEEDLRRDPGDTPLYIDGQVRRYMLRYTRKYLESPGAQ